MPAIRHLAGSRQRTASYTGLSDGINREHHMNAHTTPPTKPPHRVRVAYITHTIARHWLVIFIVLFGIFNLLPFLAPVAMNQGWTPVGEAIYTIYSTLCHQMAQRSFFLFGPAVMVNIDRLPVELTGNTAADMLLLRDFKGDETIGWKVAWSDRMVYMYGSLWLASLAYWALSRQRVPRHLPLWAFALLLLPMVVDGTTHFISDIAGLTAGFRYHNAWLADLTGNTLPASFYVGDAFGSFNSWMRLLSGALFGIACAWLALPLLDEEMRRNARILSAKLNRWRERQIAAVYGDTMTVSQVQSSPHEKAVIDG